jgi:hypothetical protein
MVVTPDVVYAHELPVIVPRHSHHSSTTHVIVVHHSSGTLSKTGRIVVGVTVGCVLAALLAIALYSYIKRRRDQRAARAARAAQMPMPNSIATKTQFSNPADSLASASWSPQHAYPPAAR